MVDVLDVYGKTFQCIKQHIHLVLVRKQRHHIANDRTRGRVGESHDTC